MSQAVGAGISVSIRLTPGFKLALAEFKHFAPIPSNREAGHLPGGCPVLNPFIVPVLVPRRFTPLADEHSRGTLRPFIITDAAVPKGAKDASATRGWKRDSFRVNNERSSPSRCPHGPDTPGAAGCWMQGPQQHGSPFRYIPSNAACWPITV